MIRASADRERRVHPLLVVTREVADEHVVPGVQRHRERLSGAARDVFDLVDVLDALALFVDVSVIADRKRVRERDRS